MINIGRVLPHIAHVLQEQYRNVQTTLNIHHQSSEVRFNNLDIKVQQSINEIQPVHRLFTALGNEGGLEIHTRVHVPRVNEVMAPLTRSSHPTSSSDQGISMVADAIDVSSIDFRVPQYRMQPWIQTVVQLWEKYDKGIVSTVSQPRGPSVRTLDEKYESQWRRSEVAKKSYWRRKFIWREVIAASENLGIPFEQVAERMDH